MGNADSVKSLTFDSITELFVKAANALSRMQHESGDPGIGSFAGDKGHEMPAYPGPLQGRIHGDLADFPNPGGLILFAHEKSADHFAFVVEGEEMAVVALHVEVSGGVDKSERFAKDTSPQVHPLPIERVSAVLTG